MPWIVEYPTLFRFVSLLNESELEFMLRKIRNIRNLRTFKLEGTDIVMSRTNLNSTLILILLTWRKQGYPETGRYLDLQAVVHH